ncbi:MAG: DsbA family protein [Romboutsia sp.]
MKNNIVAFFDYNCPFCYIGFSILEELKKQYDIQCVYKPFELYPYITPGGMTKEELMKGYDIDNIFKKLRIIGKRNNITFGNLDIKYNSHKALLLSQFAQDNNKFLGFSKILYDNYYKLDKDISDENFLMNIFSSLNLNYEQAIAEIENGNLEKKFNESLNLKDTLNIGLLPTYIINEDSILSGILTKRSFLKVLESYNK